WEEVSKVNINNPLWRYVLSSINFIKFCINNKKVSTPFGLSKKFLISNADTGSIFSILFKNCNLKIENSSTDKGCLELFVDSFKAFRRKIKSSNSSLL